MKAFNLITLDSLVEGQRKIQLKRRIESENALADTLKPDHKTQSEESVKGLQNNKSWNQISPVFKNYKFESARNLLKPSLSPTKKPEIIDEVESSSMKTETSESVSCCSSPTRRSKAQDTVKNSISKPGSV